jgi:mRNA-degrading endonuclease RelE of RelBE toxin-antitoxin system
MAVAYELYVEPAVHEARKALPGNVRQRVRGRIKALASAPRPRGSRPLKTEGLDLSSAVQIRRIRLERWRIVYAVSDAERWVWVLGIYRRPSYNYGDLADLANRLPRP